METTPKAPPVEVPAVKLPVELTLDEHLAASKTPIDAIGAKHLRKVHGTQTAAKWAAILDQFLHGRI